MIIEFKVQGSQPEFYTVIFAREGEALIATCTCAAGQNQQYCRRRFGFLSGDATDLVSDNASRSTSFRQCWLGRRLKRRCVH